VVSRILPATGWLHGYQRRWLGPDLLAGLVVWALVVPEAIAYAGIAGIPVQYGLYSVPLAVLAYMLFGTSRHLFVGPSSTVSVVAASTIAPLAAAGSDQYIVLMAVLSLMVGGFYVLFGLLRMGFIARFFAKPVLEGFIVGLGIYIVVGQLPHLVGVSKGSGNTLRQLGHILGEIGSWNWISLVLGCASLAVLFLLARTVPKAPGALIVAVLGILAVRLFDLLAHDVDVVGTVPTGFHFVPWSGVTWDHLVEMAPGALGIIVIGFAESIAIAKSFAAKHDYKINANQELIAYGASNIGAGILQGNPPTGSLSKSAAREQAGAKSQLTLLVTALLVVVTVLFIAGVFEDLPEAVLGAIVINAVWAMIDPSKLTRLYRAHAPDFWLATAALLGVLLIDILPGIVIGIVLSLVMLLHRLDHPHSAVLGRSTDGTRFADLDENPDVAAVPGMLIYRLDAPLIFANADVVMDDIDARLDQLEPKPRVLILDLESVEEIDTTGVDALTRLHHTLSARGVDVALARAHRAVRDALEREGVIELVGSDRVYSTLAAAVDALGQTPAGDE
jgi:high affinity sulfate transporter 1